MKDHKEFLKIVAENPDLPIVCMVDSDIVCDDSFGRWMGEFGAAYVGEYAIIDDDEGMIFDDREEFKERFYDSHDDELCEQFNFDPRINTYALEKGICTEEQLAANDDAEKALDAYLDKTAEEYFIKAIIVNIDCPV